MKETAEQRTARRKVASWVTQKLNNTDTQAGKIIRDCVLQALSRIDVALTDLEAKTVADKGLLAGTPLVRFYMKGGNAYKCIMEQDAREVDGGGDSDWDTQVLINPWAPEPVRRLLYAEIEELLLNEFKVTATQVGSRLHVLGFNIQTAFNTDFETDRLTFEADIQNTLVATNRLKLDADQTIRRIYDHTIIGLSFNDRVPLAKAQENAINPNPGLLFNEAIAPFSLHRLGYTFHMVDAAGKKAGLSRIALGELIDVTIPKIHTVEAVEMWESIVTSRDIVITSTPVKVYGSDFVNLPLPSIDYHQLEMMTMLGEMSDGSSRHADKLSRRTGRLNTILTGNPGKVDNMWRIAGVADVNGLTSDRASEDSFTALVRHHDLENEGSYNVQGSFKEKIKKMMIHMVKVSGSAGVAQPDFGLPAFIDEEQRRLASQTSKSRTILAKLYNTGYSGMSPLPKMKRYRTDDLALKDRLDAAGFVDARNLWASGITHWRIYQFESEKSLLQILGMYRSEATEKGVLLNVKHYQRADYRGLVSEYFIIASDAATHQITSVSTFVVGTDARTGGVKFSSADDGGKPTIATLTDIGRQRKLAASLIHDYILRTRISGHYDQIRTLIDV